MKVLLISICLLALAIALMAVKIIFVKGGKFPSGHVHDSEGLRKRGIGCSHRDD